MAHTPHAGTESDPADPDPDHGSGMVDTETSDAGLGRTLESSVAEGGARLRRPISQLVGTGLTGGLDLSLGVIALLVVEHYTGDHLLAALAFGIGFVMLSLGRSELFTENFFVPVAGLLAGRGPWTGLVRLWAGLLIGNLVAGWVAMGLLVAAHPELGSAAAAVAEPYLSWGVGWSSFAAAMLGGITITALTWIDRGSAHPTPVVIAAIGIGFVLAAPPLNHSIVGSLEMFAALHAGADFGYLDWLRVLGWAALGNLVGGVAITAVVRLLQAAPAHRATQIAERGDGEDDR